MAFNTAIYPLPRLTLERWIVVASQTLGNTVGVVEVRRQLSAIATDPGAFSGTVGADHDDQP